MLEDFFILFFFETFLKWQCLYLLSYNL